MRRLARLEYERIFGASWYFIFRQSPKSFWTLDIGYRSTYYVARFPLPHSYIGIQPAKTGGKVDYPGRAAGIHHIALWARNRKEVDAFHRDFLVKSQIPVSEAPTEYSVYAPGYYAVFFDDPINGIHWELAYTPMLPSPAAFRRWLRALKEVSREHPEWTSSVPSTAMRTLPPR